MKKRLALIALLTIALLIAGCAPVTSVPTAAPETTANTSALADEVVLTLTGITQTVTLTMDELQALPSITGQGGIKSSTGAITPPSEFTGVSVADLMAMVDGFTDTAGVVGVARDGYSITFSHGQVSNGDFIYFDPVSGDEVEKPADNPVLVAAYAQNGQPLDPNSDGPLRLAVLGTEPVQVVDGHWAVKWISSLAVREAAQDWVLNIEGGISEVMDRGTFESGAAPDCHGESWTDGEGQIWHGIPLWRLAGWGDDEIKHTGPAFSDELAKIGYQIEIVAADGYTVTLDSDRVTRHDEVIVAYLVNDAPLPEKYFPLRLVGEGLENSEMVGAISTIRLLLPETVEGPAVGSDLVVSGLVNFEIALSKDALSRMEMVTISAEAPKAEAAQDFVGVRINDLLGQAEPAADATTVVFVAYDGYESEQDLAAVLACTDCLVGFDETGKIRTVMPGFGGGAWVKDVVRIEVRGPSAEEEEQAPAAETTTAAPTVGLEITGLVSAPQSFTAEVLAALPAATVSVQHPKEDTARDWTGYLLSDLLALTEPQDGATKLVIVASDGYRSEVPFSSIANCADCMVAVEDGLLRMVIPGAESQAWVKDVATLEVQ